MTSPDAFGQQSLHFEPQESEADLPEVRSLLGGLIERSSLYRSGKQYHELLGFIGKLRNFAPFNAMLLQIQKPGLTYAASAVDWATRFQRRPKEDARPLLILWPFAPVALVYDVLDTEGRDLPDAAAMFPARGKIDDARFTQLLARLASINITHALVDSGDGHAGSIRVASSLESRDNSWRYTMKINRNHPPAIKFVTLCHELGHLYLGHLGHDKKLAIPDRRGLAPSLVELEAESVAYIMASRCDVDSKPEQYLSRHIEQDLSIHDLDIYQVMRATGQVETALGLGVRSRVA